MQDQKRHEQIACAELSNQFPVSFFSAMAKVQDRSSGSSVVERGGSFECEDVVRGRVSKKLPQLERAGPWLSRHASDLRSNLQEADRWVKKARLSVASAEPTQARKCKLFSSGVTQSAAMLLAFGIALSPRRIPRRCCPAKGEPVSIQQNFQRQDGQRQVDVMAVRGQKFILNLGPHICKSSST